MVQVTYAIVSAIIGLGILIVIHELGHFLLAKKTGVGVLTFSVGFGPKLWVRKVGETEYALSAFPLGGYVKMVGEDPQDDVEAKDIERSFVHQGLAKRMAIVAAGPIFNLLLAVVIFSSIFIAVGKPVLTTKVDRVESDSPAAQVGVLGGDRIIEVNGHAVKDWQQLSSRIQESQGRPLKLRLVRGGQEIEVAVRPVKREATDIFGEKKERWAIGIIMGEVVFEKSPPWVGLRQGLYETGSHSAFTLLALFKMLKGDLSPRNLGGPLLIAQVAGKQAQEGPVSFFFFVAVLSVNLGVLNLLPIPILDGGHLLFFLIEWMRGRPVELRYRERAQQVGIFFLILIMIYAFYNDILRFFE